MNDTPKVDVVLHALPPDHDIALSKNAVCQMLGLSHDQSNRLVPTDAFPVPIYINGSLRVFWRSEILNWMEQNRGKPLPAANPAGRPVVDKPRRPVGRPRKIQSGAEA